MGNRIKPRSESDFLNSMRSRNHNFIYAANVFFRIDPSTQKYQFITSGIEELTGYTIKELEHIDFRKLIKTTLIDNSDEYEFLDSEGKTLFRKEYFGQYLIVAKDGSTKFIKEKSYSISDSNGKILDRLGLLIDNTELNFLIDTLHEEKKKLDIIFDLADVIFVVLDESGNIMMINHKGCNLLGYPSGELVSKTWREFVPDEYYMEAEQIFRKVIAGKDKDFGNVRGLVKTKTGEIRTIEWHYTLLENPDGKKILVSSGQDITEREREEKLQSIILEILQTANSDINLEEFFSIIHNRISQVMKADNFYIAIYDETNEMISFPYFKDEYDDDSSPKKFGKGLTEYVIRNGKAELIDLKRDAELKQMGEIELIGTNSPIWLGAPFRIQDRVIGAIVVQDYKNPQTYTEKDKSILEFISFPISRAIERKIAEQEREELIIKLKEINTSKDKLFSAISHDLRSPFNSLLGFSEILTTEYESLTHDEIKEYLNVIHETSKSLYAMTNNLLQYSRFQMGRIDINKELTSLDKIIRTSVNMLKGNAIKKQISLMLDLEEEIEILCDEDMITSSIQNLLSNAIKFTPKSGDIRISLKITDRNSTEPLVELKIEDSGVGMSSQSIEKILKGEMFTNPGTEKEFGTGLGMLLVREFIEKNNGTLRINSKLNKGSTFTIIFPANAG